MKLPRLAVVALSAALLGALPAVATTVQPILIDLNATGRNMSAVLQVQNTQGTPLPVEIKVDRLKFSSNGAEIDGPSDDLSVFPAQVVIPPNQQQVFRIQWVGDPKLAESRSYYVTVAQQPVTLPSTVSAVQVVYNFQTLVSVRPAAGEPKLGVVQASIGKDEKGAPAPVAVIGNTSSVHGYIPRGRIRVVQRDNAGKVLIDRNLSAAELEQAIGFGLVAPGQRRTVVLPVRLPADQGRVEVSYTPNR